MPWRVLSPCVYGRANHGCCCTAFNPAAFPSARPRFPSVGLARTPLVQLETTSAQPTAEPTRQGHGVLRECLCPLYRHALLAAPFPRRRADPLPRPVDRSAGLPQLRSPQRRVQRQHGPLYVSHSSFYATALPAGRGPYAGARFWTLRPPPRSTGAPIPTRCVSPGKALHPSTVTHKFESNSMYADSFAPPRLGRQCLHRRAGTTRPQRDSARRQIRDRSRTFNNWRRTTLRGTGRRA